MRKKYLLGMTLMASLAFSSCTKEVFVVQDGEGVEEIQEDGQVLTLQVSNSGDGLTTRDGRPLLSSQAKQDINHIDLFVVNSSNKVVLKKTVKPSEWANALDYTTGGHGKQLQISFKGSEGQKLIGSSAGTAYTIYAVAYKESSNYATTFGVSEEAPTTTSDNPTVTFTETNFATTLTANGTPADEIFAGKVEVKVVEADGDSYITTSTGSTKKEKPTLVLNRQVAGVTGYFTNLPAKVGDQIPTKIRLVASNKSNKVHFTSMVSGETDAAATSGVVTSVVNGSWSGEGKKPEAPYWNSGLTNKGYKVYEIDLANFFAQMSGESDKTFDKLDLDGDGFVGYKDAQYYVYKMNTSGISFEDLAAKADGETTFLEKTWAEAIKGKEVTVNEKKVTANKLEGFWKNANANQTLVAGSVFAGEFIIPFLQESGTNTFELQLLAHNNILKTWNVQVPKGQTVGAGQGSVADNTIGSWSVDTSTLIYNIYRNHLYSLGMKTNDIEGGGEPGTTDPDPKPQPDPDPNPEDKPEDLSKGQDLLINVNDNWEIIHQMEID